jgi:hypothetical protein|tara:strand:+ start:105 stop:377 length:273 start_codon:yes stop_codon:yes gene_type:complete
MKEGISTMYKNQDRPMQEYEFITLTERAEKHSSRHPSDSNVPKTERGVTWGKAGKRTAELKKFYKTHVYTFVDKDMNKAWVRIAGKEEEE